MPTTRTPASELDSLLTPTDSLSVTAGGELQIEGRTAGDLLRQFGSPLYVISERTLRANYRRIRDAFAAAWPQPVTILYAIKANNTLAIRAILSEEGAGGDCFGAGEIHATMAANADPSKVVLNGSNKDARDLEQAARLGMTVNIDAEDEIDAVAAIAEKVGRTVRVKLRLKVPAPELNQIATDYFETASGLADYVRRVKWGFSVDAAEPLIRRLKSLNGVELRGFHFHIGRASQDPDFCRKWARALVKQIATLHQRTGFAPAVIDVGGGWPRERDPESRNLARNPTTIDAYAAATCEALLEGLQQAGLPVPELWLEPGRYIVGNAVLLLTTVGAVKRDLGLTWVNVDASTNNLMRIDTSGSAYHVVPAIGMQRPSVEPATIVGATCTDSIIAAERCLPRVARGEPMAVLDAGMYAEVASTQLNAVPRPATVLINGDGAELVKERETVQDVFAKHRIPDRLSSVVSHQSSVHAFDRR